MLGGYLNAKNFRRKTRIQQLSSDVERLRSEKGKLQERQNELLTKLLAAEARCKQAELNDQATEQLQT